MTQRIGQQVEGIPHCHRLNLGVHQDARGNFSKVFSTELQARVGISFVPREIFWSRSYCGVVRGMHTQLPPHAGAKLVWVSQGQVRDVVLDLRRDSETYGNCLVSILDDSSGGLYIPQGCAHGFEVLSDQAVVNYAQDVDHAPAHDSGIAWSSFSFDWVTQNPIVSDRDKDLPLFSEFSSPFKMPDSL